MNKTDSPVASFERALIRVTQVFLDEAAMSSSLMFAMVSDDTPDQR